MAWLGCVAGALAVTLRSLATDDNDGLNYLFQIPFALPWALLFQVRGQGGNALAVHLAVSGAVNSVLVFAIVRFAIRRKSRA